MGSAEADRLAGWVRGSVEEMKEACKGLNDATASFAPSGRWSPKQILSHLCGPEGVGYTASVKAMLEQDTPRLERIGPEAEP